MIPAYTHLCRQCRFALVGGECPLGHDAPIPLSDHEHLVSLGWDRWPRPHRRILSFTGWAGALSATALARGALPVLALTSLAALAAELTGRGKVGEGAPTNLHVPERSSPAPEGTARAGDTEGAFGPFARILAGTATLLHSRGVSLRVGYAAEPFHIELEQGWIHIDAGPVIVLPGPSRYSLRKHEARAIARRLDGPSARTAFPFESASASVVLDGTRVRVHAELERIPDDDVGYREMAAEGWRCVPVPVLSPAA